MPQLLIKGQSIGSIKGVLFDKDGTLVNSEKYLLEISNLRLDQTSRVLFNAGTSLEKINKVKDLLCLAYGIENDSISPEGLIAIASKNSNLISTATIISLIGESWPNALEKAINIFKNVNEIEISRQDLNKKREMISGVKSFLNKLYLAEITCALISNDSKDGIINFINTNRLEGLIKMFWSAEDNPPKPDPYSVKALCKSINLNPSECALIGDADSDLKMARQAGIGITIGFTGGWSRAPRLTQQEYLIEHWDDLSIQ